MRAHDHPALLDFAVAVHSLNDFQTPRIQTMQADFDTNSPLLPPYDSFA